MTRNPARQPKPKIANATTGTPITLPSFCDPSKIAVARPRSRRGNQYPVAFELAGNDGASAIPNRNRPANKLQYPVDAAVIAEATPHSPALSRPIPFTPNRSSTSPIGICSPPYDHANADSRMPICPASSDMSCCSCGTATGSAIRSK